MSSRKHMVHSNDYGDYSNGTSFKDSIPRHDSYYSPSATSFKTPTKLTPKSILKESWTSGSKAKKNIKIDEALNETRKISAKNEYSDYFTEKRPKILTHEEQRNQAGQRSNVSIGGPLDGRYGQQDISPPTTDHQQNNVEKNRYQLDRSSYGDSHGFSKASFDKNINYELSREGLTEYQKAYVRKMQRERELEIHSDMLFRPNSDYNKDDYMSRSNPEFYLESQTNGGITSKNDFWRYKDGKLSTRSKDSEGGWGALDKFPDLDHIEDKIYELEKNLDKYSRKLRESIERQKDYVVKDDNVKRGQKASGSSKKLKSKKKSKYQSGNEESKKGSAKKSGKGLEDENENEKSLRGRSNIKSPLKSAPIVQYQDPRYETDQQLEMRRELEYLREENEKLRGTLHGGKNHGESVNKQSQKHKVKEVLDKEKELLQVIDHMRTKLIKSTTKNTPRGHKSSKETLRSSSVNKERLDKLAQPKKPFELPKKDDVNKERIHLAREAYGPRKLEKENVESLYEGISTSYNGFHWNADQSLKISKNLY